jgi:hypothetical protein
MTEMATRSFQSRILVEIKSVISSILGIRRWLIMTTDMKPLVDPTEILAKELKHLGGMEAAMFAAGFRGQGVVSQACVRHVARENCLPFRIGSKITNATN